MNLDKPKLEPIRTCEEPKTEEVDRNTPKYEPVRTCEKPKTSKVDRDTPKYEPIRTCEKPKTEKDDREIPKSRPGITFESPNTDKDGKDDIASKPDDTPKISKPDDKGKKIDGASQKPKDKPKNKIEPKKIDTKKEPKHKIQRAKFDSKTQPRNKIRLRQMDIRKEPKHKIQHRKLDPKTPPRHKIEPRKINYKKEPKYKIQAQQFTPAKPKNKFEPKILEISPKSTTKIERIPNGEPKSTTKPEVKQHSLERVQQEMKKINWSSISENWTVRVSANKEITLNPYTLPSKENPLYKHKQWLQTVYNHKNWNLNDNGLRTISGVSHTTIYKWRKKFNISTKKLLSNDGKQKECGRCHQIKPQSEFKVRNDKRKDKPYSRSNCSKCKNELNQIYIFKNKLRILAEICGGKDKIKCSGCETKVNQLPAFDFHHPDNKFKELQRIRINKNWNKTIEILEKEKVIPLCKNCHAEKKTTVYNKFKEIILKRNNFEKKLEGIENNIHQYVKTNFNYNNPKSQLIQIKSWIKKRIVIEKLFNGNCIGCGEKKLPSLQFHHKNPEKKTYRSWSDINNLNIKEIIKKFKEDNAICLCANCHSMAESRHFKENMGEILENKDLHEARTSYKKLNQKINNYSFPNQREIQINFKPELKQPNQNSLSSSDIQSYTRKVIEPLTNISENRVNGKLKYQYAYGEAWKKYLSHINKLLNEGKMVQTKTLAESVGVNTRNTRKNIQKLIVKGMISINGEYNNRIIALTEKGVNESKKIYLYI